MYTVLWFYYVQIPRNNSTCASLCHRTGAEGTSNAVETATEIGANRPETFCSLPLRIPFCGMTRGRLNNAYPIR